jgi:ABC-type lipoprotein release transport system permease subunit
MFMLESLLLGLGGTLAGALIGSGIATLVNRSQMSIPTGMQLFLMSDRLHLAVHPGGLVFAVILITTISVLAAIYPSERAARLPPVAAMSHFG